MCQCESASVCETEIGRHSDVGATETISDFLSPTHTSIISTSGELFAKSRLVRPLLPHLWCKTRTNYTAAVLSSFSLFIIAVIRV